MGPDFKEVDPAGGRDDYAMARPWLAGSSPSLTVLF
jgi:hypothetical protein